MQQRKKKDAGKKKTAQVSRSDSSFLPSTTPSRTLSRKRSETKSSSKTRQPDERRPSHAVRTVSPTIGVAPALQPRVRPTNSHNLFQDSQYLRDRWYIKGMIGQGGYGEIYLALDTKEALHVAIKTERRIRRGKTSKRMILEQRVLLRLQGKPHVPMMLASGHDEQINFIVMQLLSVNVGDLKKQAPFKRLSRSTVGRILMQGIAALRDIHLSGYLHRDVKPANMCFGLTATTRHILMLVDFGLVRRFKTGNGTLRRQRKRAGFRGTLRYVSPRVHDRLEQQPVDDLVSLVYSGIELLLGDLPWKVLTRHDDVKAAKEELRDLIGEEDSYLALAPDSFQLFCREMLNMGQPVELDYTEIQAFLTEMIGQRGLADPYDWENSFKETETESQSTISNPR